MSSAISQLSCLSSINKRFLFPLISILVLLFLGRCQFFLLFFFVYFSYLFFYFHFFCFPILLNPLSCFELLIYVFLVIGKLVFFIGCLLYSCLFGGKREGFEEIPEIKTGRNLMNFWYGVMLIWLKMWSFW